MEALALEVSGGGIILLRPHVAQCAGLEISGFMVFAIGRIGWCLGLCGLVGSWCGRGEAG